MRFINVQCVLSIVELRLSGPPLSRTSIIRLGNFLMSVSLDVHVQLTYQFNDPAYSVIRLSLEPKCLDNRVSHLTFYASVVHAQRGIR